MYINEQAIEMYFEDGMDEGEIAKSLGIKLIEVHSILAEAEKAKAEETTARLIAAAPDMYALLQDVHALLTNPDADQFDADKVERKILDILDKVEGV